MIIYIIFFIILMVLLIIAIWPFEVIHNEEKKPEERTSTSQEDNL